MREKPVPHAWGVARPLDLNVLVSDVLQLVGPMLGPGIVTQVRRGGALPLVQADPSQLVQALLNLCLNARDAMPTGGHLVLETAFLTLGPEEASGHLGGRTGSFVRLAVIDTGHGMEPEVRAHIFEPFFTTKEPGGSQGLGLAIVAYVARRHRGWVECTSTPSQGTRFDLYLPAITTPALAHPVVSTQAPGGKTVLVVDNDHHILRLARAILEKDGYRVLQAESGTQAVEVYRQGGIDLVLLDQNMPGLSGAGTLSTLLALDPGVRVLLASGFTLEEIPPSTRVLLRGFLSKPYRPDDLLQAVRSALTSPQAER